MAESNLKKRMSDLGQTNQSLTVENNSKMAGMNDLGSISQQQQDYINQQNYLQKQANLQTQAQNAELSANNYSAQLNALINDENSRFGIYYNLLNNKKITRAQFKNLTGIDVKDIPSGSGSSSSSGNDINSFINSNTSNTNGIGLAKVDTSPSASDTTHSISK